MLNVLELYSEIRKKIDKIVTEVPAFKKKLSKNPKRGRVSKEDERRLEASTESVLLNPFFRIFGYNTESLTEHNRAEKQYKVNRRRADFALFKDNKLVIVVECKTFGANLANSAYINQLSEYFNNISPSPKFGVLTNGTQYKFYGAFHKKNRMDKNISFEFDILTDADNSDKLISLYKIIAEVNEHEAKRGKVYERTREFIEEEILNNQSEVFVRKGVLEAARDIGKSLHEGKVISNAEVIKIQPIVSKIIDDCIKERVNHELIQTQNPENNKSSKLEFNQLEQQALFIIQAIAAEINDFDVNRISEVDYQSVCNVTIDGLPRSKKICGLYFNNPDNLSIQLNGFAYNLNSPADIYNYKTEIKNQIAKCI